MFYTSNFNELVDFFYIEKLLRRKTMRQRRLVAITPPSPVNSNVVAFVHCSMVSIFLTVGPTVGL